MREKGKRLIAIILSCLLLLSNVTVYAATEAEEQSDTQNTVSVNASEEVVTLPEEPINGSAGEEAVIQNEPNAEDTSDETETLAPINATDPLEILETPKNMVGIEISSFNFLPTTRSVGIPTVGSTATGTCYIGDTWNVNYPYQDYFYVNNFTGDLTGAVTVQDFECLDPTAALPTHKNASYEATVTEVNAVGGYIEYYVRVTPPGATDGVTRPDGEHLSGYQHVGGKVRVYRAFAGSLELIKSSANQTITNGNSCYSLKGAVYGLYQNGIEIARKTTDVNGYAKFENVTAGNYDLKEITPPKGYALDKRTYPVTINSSQTTRVDVKDYPQSDPVSILLGKVDKDTTQNMPQGSASLEGAEFTIKYYAVHSDKDPAESGKKPVRTWVLKTNKDGKTAMVDSLKVSGDEFFKTSQGYNTLPLGTITIQETKAPKGYLLNEEIFVRQITSKGTTEGVETYNMPTIEEEVIRGDIQLVKYGENNDEPGDSGADIKKPLKDIKFHLTSKTNGDVYTIITDENGFASTKQFGNSERGNLPFDTYTVTEESPYPEYDIIAPFEVTVDEEGKTYSYILRNDTVDAPLSVQKVDKETGKVIPIAGAQFQILDENKKPITMEVHYPTPMEIDTFETDANGSFTLPEKLEHGSYYLHETKAPEGYLLGVEDIPFVVDQEFDWENPLSITYPDAPAKGKIRVTKTDKETDKPIPSGAEFTVTAAEDITTPDGTIRTEKGTVVATLTTDEKGKAETEALYLGKYMVKETKAPNGYLLNPKEFAVTLEYEDQETEIVYGNVTVPDELAKGKIRVKKTDAETGSGLSGAEFTVTAAEDITTPDGTIRTEKGTVVATLTTDDKGKAETDKLYLGKYVIKETKAPEGYLLNPKEFEVTLAYKDQTTEIVYGDVTVPNQPAKGQIEILKKDEETGNLLSGTEFTVTAAEDITTPDGTVRAEKGTVVDTIVTDTTGIARSKELYLGKYVVKETKQPIGFIRPNQTWDVELKYADQKTELVKENLTIKNQPTEIIIDKKETGTDKPLEGVKFVIWNKDKEDPIDPGMQHKEIYTTDKNGKIRLLYLEPGNYAVAEVESIPGYAWDDKMIYEFTITEDGRVDGEVSHTIPVGNDRTEITETNAINVSTGTQDAFAVDLTIVDTVSIVNLMPNREYTLKLVLADAETGESLQVKDQPSGDLLTTEKTFTADDSKMDVPMEIQFNASAFAGRTIAVYEYFYQDGVEISKHEDPNDKKQQIYVKDKLKLNTTAIDLISGTHEAIAKKDVTIRDNVDHFGLIEGQEYVLKGILMDQKTEEPLLIDGKPITAEKTVQITEADGTVNMDFTLNASELNNHSIVVYEYLYHDGQLIASHEDINDEDQTITFKVGSLKPTLPPNKGGGLLSALKTGDFSDITPFAIALIGTGTIILSIVIYNFIKKKKCEE
ncbi:MAG: SpaA isopeptide-forming pilin-related protein [[Ruminococcus] torques]|uniref:SpaA isopeptide-forming pilin-related protein n=1 Tax=[Ruminococcus] torques TaxID=33039 RepID=UPI00399FDFF3